jgi:hypothetical protein
MPSRAEEPKDSTDTKLIRPGRSVGLLQLGSTRDEAIQALGEPNNDDKRELPCVPRTLDWTDVAANRTGIIFAYLTNGRIAQIEVAAPRYHTVDGITESTLPEEVRRHYPQLRAYALLNSGADFVGGRDLIYWIEPQQGIAFEFQYSRKTQKRFLASISIFVPGADFLPHARCVESPQEWRELQSFALEAPNDHKRKAH